MQSGKVIKFNSKQYAQVEAIDIFSMQHSKLVSEFNIPVLGNTNRDVIPYFVEQESFPQKQTKEISETPSDQAEEIRETVSVELIELDSLKARISMLEKELKEKEKETLEMKKGYRKEGYERGYQEGITKGVTDGTKDIHNAVAKIEKDVETELSKLKQTSENLWESVGLLIESGLNKIIGKSLNADSVKEIIEKVKKSFPDEKKIVFRVSEDIYQILAGVEKENIQVVKDTAMKPRSIVAELADGVADFSIDTQIKKIIKWLGGEQNV